MAKTIDTLVITGAAGFIGRQFLSCVQRSGYKLILIDRIKPADLDRKLSAHFISCDITDRRQLGKIKNIKGKITLVHIAAYVPRVPLQEEKDTHSILKTNIVGTANILEYLKNKLSRVCYVSTLEVYGMPVYLPIDENHPANPVSFYGISKLSAEHYVRLFCARHNIAYAILRFSSVYGPGENYDRAIPNFIKSCVRGRPIMIYGDGSDVRDYLYVDDATEALLLAIQNQKIEGIFNIASGKGYKIRDIAKMVIKLSNSKSKIKFCERRKKHHNLVFNILKARKKLKFLAKTKIEDGLLKEIEWFKLKYHR